MTKSTPDLGVTQTARNITSNLAFIVVDILYNLWYTPYLILKLGSELFGFIPLATSVTNYFSLLTQSLNISMSRHITIRLAKGETERAGQIFNTNLIVTLLLISLALPLGFVLVLLLPDLFKMPENSTRDIQLLFLCIVISFLLTTLRVNFSIGSFASNRFDLRNIGFLGARIIQVAVILILFSFKQPSLLYVGIGAVSAAIFNLAGEFYLWKTLLPEFKFRWRDFQIKDLRLVLGSGSLTFIYQIGFLIFLNVDILVANRMLDLKTAGMFAALVSIPKNLRILSSAIGGVWGPAILSKFSASDFDGINTILIRSIRLIGLSMALPIGLISGLSVPFLTVWLGPDFGSMGWLLALMVFPLSTNLIVEPFFNVNISMSKLKIPSLVILSMSLLNLWLAIKLAPQFGAMGIVIAGMVTLSLNYSIFIPIYTAKVMGFSFHQYSRHLISILLVTFLIAACAYFVSTLISLNSFTLLIVSATLISLMYLPFVYFIGINASDRETIHTWTKSWLQKVKSRS